MRTIKELLVILRDYVIETDNFDSGLCIAKWDLYLEKKITLKELELLTDYLDENIPLTFNVIISRILDSDFRQPVVCHWWAVGKKEPRIKWLNKHIKKNMR